MTFQAQKIPPSVDNMEHYTTGGGGKSIEISCFFRKKGLSHKSKNAQIIELSSYRPAGYTFIAAVWITHSSSWGRQLSAFLRRAEIYSFAASRASTSPRSGMERMATSKCRRHFEAPTKPAGETAIPFGILSQQGALVPIGNSEPKELPSLWIPNSF